jgi:hypothetical protein
VHFPKELRLMVAFCLTDGELGGTEAAWLQLGCRLLDSINCKLVGWNH